METPVMSLSEVAVLNCLNRAVINIMPTAADIRNLFITFKTEQRRNVARIPEFQGSFMIEQGSVCKKLEIAIGIVFENAQQLLMHQRFSPKDPKKERSLPFSGIYNGLYLYSGAYIPCVRSK